LTYREGLIETATLKFEWILQIVQRNETEKFTVLTKRWIIEWTSNWFHSK